MRIYSCSSRNQMVTDSIIRHLLSDKDSLSDYYAGKIPAYEDVCRRLFLLERLENTNIPDHYYRMNRNKSLYGINDLRELIRIGLYRLGKEHLEFRENRIYVQQKKQNRWQELITYIPPLVLQMAFLHIEKPLTGNSRDEITAYFHKYILPNTRNTALPYPYIAQLDAYIKGENGLHDLHMHLNGTTETDRTWADFLAEPNKIYKEIKSATKNKLAKEQFEQEFATFTPVDLSNMLFSARYIRDILLAYVLKQKLSPIVSSPEELLNRVRAAGTCYQQDDYGSVYHPFTRIISDGPECEYPLAVEGLMYILVFNHLAQSSNNLLASLMHYYLLILGLCNRMLVQQSDQYGFEQFQKITVNELRSESEKRYRNRFLQLSGNDNCNIRYLEGRFSPKETKQGNLKLLKSIDDGWKGLLNNLPVESQNSDVQTVSGKNLTKPEPMLQLTAHFIKKKEDYKDDYIRFKSLRKELQIKAQQLGYMKQEHSRLMNRVVGIDAASNELDTPPEVFAPIFRYLRYMGFTHFTYHAGEEFFHIISGLRAIYEAIVFTGMQHGDRVGHATAAGISSEIWRQNIGDKLFMRKGEYMDDLIFTYHLIVDRNCKPLIHIVPSLLNRIQQLAYEVYDASYPINILTETWLLRRFCPIALFEHSEIADGLTSSDFNRFESDEIRQQNIKTEHRRLLEKYHSKECREQYDKVIEVEIDEIYSLAELETLQQLVLHFMHENEIVIETLPTSNVRIGHHRDFATHQLWNWLRWEKEGKAIPPIVIGTDDPGIFATNIYNEYANLYCRMVHGMNYSHTEAMEILKKLNHNGQVYCFKE